MDSQSRGRWMLAGVASLVTVGYFYGPLRGRQSKERIRLADQKEPIAIAAAAAVTEFHSALGQASYDSICKTAEPGAFKGISATSCADFLEYVRKKLGVPMASIARMPVTGDCGSPPMPCIEVAYETHFEHGVAREDFSWRSSGKELRLISYSVQSDELSR